MGFPLFNKSYTDNDNWSWKPTADQQKLFEEWKNFCLGYLVSSRERINVQSIPHFVEDHVGEQIPLEKMGFPTVNHFLYQMRAYLEVRRLNWSLFICVKEAAVPEHLRYVRSMVKNQKDKGGKTKTAKSKLRAQNNSISTSVEDLLRYAHAPQAQTQPHQGNSRPAMAPVGNRNPGSRGRNQLISRPAQPRISNIKNVPRTSTPIRSDYRNVGMQNNSSVNVRPSEFGRFYVAPTPSNGPFHRRPVPPPGQANFLSRNCVATANSNMSGFDDPIVARSTLAKTPTATNANSPRKLLKGTPASEPQVVNGISTKDVPIHNLRITEVKPEVSSAGIRPDEPKPKAAPQPRSTVAQGRANTAINDGDIIDFNINDRHTLEPNGLSSCPFKDWKARLPYPERDVIFPNLLFGESQAKASRRLRTFLLSQ